MLGNDYKLGGTQYRLWLLDCRLPIWYYNFIDVTTIMASPMRPDIYICSSEGDRGIARADQNEADPINHHSATAKGQAYHNIAWWPTSHLFWCTEMGSMLRDLLWTQARRCCSRPPIADIVVGSVSPCLSRLKSKDCDPVAKSLSPNDFGTCLWFVRNFWGLTLAMYHKASCRDPIAPAGGNPLAFRQTWAI